MNDYDAPALGRILLRQGPRGGIRDHGVGEIGDCRHHFDFVL